MAEGQQRVAARAAAKAFVGVGFDKGTNVRQDPWMTATSIVVSFGRAGSTGGRQVAAAHTVGRAAPLSRTTEPRRAPVVMSGRPHASRSPSISHVLVLRTTCTGIGACHCSILLCTVTEADPYVLAPVSVSASESSDSRLVGQDAGAAGGGALIVGLGEGGTGRSGGVAGSVSQLVRAHAIILSLYVRPAFSLIEAGTVNLGVNYGRAPAWAAVLARTTCGVEDAPLYFVLKPPCEIMAGPVRSAVTLPKMRKCNPWTGNMASTSMAHGRGQHRPAAEGRRALARSSIARSDLGGVEQYTSDDARDRNADLRLRRRRRALPSIPFRAARKGLGSRKDI
ncbi:hypothetical protein C8Q77DRAFT_350387 [Trametes polyzona]|nr:hypothetical protein C8Q77DRAFT_350387 [Trametes polyzona]